jgi:hypothetical protein
VCAEQESLTEAGTTVSNRYSEGAENPNLCSKATCFATVVSKIPAAVAGSVSEKANAGGNSNWILVDRKTRRKNRLSGKMGVAGDDVKFKAAESMIPIFITNVHKDTEESDIVQYIMNKTQEKVSLVKMVSKRDTRYNAYELFVPRIKLSIFLDNTLWPKGIIFRRFVHFRYSETERVKSVKTLGDDKN